MILHIHQVIALVPVTTIRRGKLTAADRAAIVAAFQNADEVIRQVELTLDTIGYAYCSSQSVGAAEIEQEGNTMRIYKRIIIAPAEQVEVDDAKSAAALLRERLGQPVSMQHGGKRLRYTSSGEIIRSSARRPFSDEQLAASVPVVATFSLAQRAPFVCAVLV